MMYNDLKLTFALLRDPFVWLVLGISLLGTLLLFAGLAALAGGWVASSDAVQLVWLRDLAGYASGFLMLVLGWFLFPMVFTAISCLFLDQLAARIEQQHYPDMGKAKATDWGDLVVLASKTLWHTVLYNLLGLPFYFIPILNVLVFAGINALLLGHEYFHALALRHISLAEAEQVYLKGWRPCFKTGLVLAVLFLIPGLNLIAPILALGLMLHRLERRPDGLLRAVVKT